jgi:hypothetical protein
MEGWPYERGAASVGKWDQGYLVGDSHTVCFVEQLETGAITALLAGALHQFVKRRVRIAALIRLRC